MNYSQLRLYALALTLISALGLYAQNTPEAGAETGSARTPLFPGAFSKDYLILRNAGALARPYWVETEAETEAWTAWTEESILLNNDVLAFYGHPFSKNMGILGRYTKEEIAVMLKDLAGEYLKVSGGRGLKTAFYLIYGTVWPAGEIGILREDVTKEYIEYALEQDMLVFLDHQIGRYDPVESLKRMLPWLRYPNVHLALDPEWRTTKPMKEIGSVRAEELNRVQRVMEDYITEQQIPGDRMLVVHQFNRVMISSREKVVTGFSHVRLVHCMDGFGAPHLKKDVYNWNALAGNMPMKGFKLFYNFDIPGAGFDQPILSPREVYALSPRPYVIMYQ